MGTFHEGSTLVHHLATKWFEDLNLLPHSDSFLESLLRLEVRSDIHQLTPQAFLATASNTK